MSIILVMRLPRLSHDLDTRLGRVLRVGHLQMSLASGKSMAKISRKFASTFSKVTRKALRILRSIATVILVSALRALSDRPAVRCNQRGA